MYLYTLPLFVQKRKLMVFILEGERRIYVGKDKHENSFLVKNGIEKDVWFHVENLSSAHVYLQMKEEEDFDFLEKDWIEKCAQLTKETSIDGSKCLKVWVVFTEWTNLREGLNPGEVFFHDKRKTKRVLVEGNNRKVFNFFKKNRKEIEIEKHIEEQRERLSLRRKEAFDKKKQENILFKQKRKKKEDDKKARKYEDVFVSKELKNLSGIDPREYEDTFFE